MVDTEALVIVEKDVIVLGGSVIVDVAAGRVTVVVGPTFVTVLVTVTGTACTFYCRVSLIFAFALGSRAKVLRKIDTESCLAGANSA